MSFFDLENELPRWLDGEIKKRPGFKEIVIQADINQMDHTSKKSYHMVCADKGSMAGGSQDHHIWKFEAPKGNIRAYGKYLEFTGITPVLKFWIGLVVQDKTMNLYLWFGTISDPVQTHLSSVLDEEVDKGGYWYKGRPGNSGQAPGIPTECCGCGSLPLNKDDLGKLEQEVKKAIGDLLDAVAQAGKTI